MSPITTAVRAVWITIRAAVLVAMAMAAALPPAAHAQDAKDPRLKEVKVEAKSFLVGEPTPAWVEPVAIPASDEKHPVVVRLVDTQYLVDQTIRVYMRRALAINDAASLTKAGQVLIPFVPEYQLIRLHAVRVLRGSEVLDRTTSATVRFFQRETGLEQGVYSGEVTAAILVSDLRVGDTLEVSYTREGQNPVFGSKLIDFVSWDQGQPSLHRRVAVTAPAERPFAWKVLGSDAKGLKPAETVDAGRRRLVFEERGISSVQPEPLTPAEHNPYRYLQLSEFASWEDVVAWAQELFAIDAEPDNAELGELVAKLRASKTDAERIVTALELVQSEIRYFSVSLGESSHRPAAPGVVLKRRYGDCKDKSLLLIALLRALGIEANPVLVAVGSGRALDKALPSPTLFNHVIVQVKADGQLHYLDPSRLGQHGALSRLGQVHAHAQVLPIAAGTRGLVTIPEPRSTEPRSEVVESAILPSFTGDGELRVRQTWRGVAAEGVRVMHRHVPREQIWKSLDETMEQRYPGAKPLGQHQIEDDRARNAVTVSTAYTIPKLAIEQNGNWYVRYLPSNLRGALPPPQSATRSAPLQLPAFPFSAAYTFEITLPDTVRVVADPHVTTVKGKHFSYTATSHFRGHHAKTTLELRVTRDQVAPGDLKKYADDVRAVEAARIGVVFVPKSAIKSRGGKKKDLSDLLRERLKETITQTSQAIKAGKLGAKDLAGAHCLRSNAYDSLGEGDKALADANAALKLTPQAPEALHCRGLVYFGLGDYDKAIADYSKALTLGGAEATIKQRGVARFYAGQLEAAAEDFARASELSDKEDQVYSDLWLTWSLQRLGKPLPEDLIKRAAADPRGAWPRPALALYSGDLQPDELVRLLERKSGDEGRMAAAEGYFYLGQYYLARGDTAKARELFQRTRAANVLIYIEHKAAELELRKLPAPATGAAAGAAAGDGPEQAATTTAKRRKTSAETKARRPGAGTEDWRQGVFAR